MMTSFSTGVSLQPIIIKTKVIIKNGKTVAFCTYEKCPNCYSGSIYLVAVDQNHRKNGYASRLIQSALNDFDIKGVQDVEISVHRENESALVLYQNKFKFEFDIKGDEDFIRLVRTGALKYINWVSL